MNYRLPNNVLFASLCMMITSSSCRKDEPEAEAVGEPEVVQESTVVLDPNTIWIDEPTAGNIVSVDSVEIVFQGATDQLTSLGLGNIIVCGIAEGAPYGFLRRIISIQNLGQHYTLTTENVSLTEAFDELQVDHTKNFSLDDTLRDGPVFTVNLPNVILFDADGDEGTTFDQVKLNGSMDLSPTLDVQIDITQGQLNHAKIEGRFEADLTNTFIAGGSVGLFGAEVPFYEQPLTPFAIPGTPIVIVPVVVVRVGAEGEIQVQITAGYSSEMDVSAFVEYEGGSWQTGFNRTMSNMHSLSAINGQIAAKAYVQPGLDFRFWGTRWARGYVQAEAYLSATASLLPTPACEFMAGLTAEIGANLRLFRTDFLNVNYPDLFDHSLVLYQCNGQPTLPVAEFSGTPTSIVTGSAVSFTDLSSGWPTSWAWDFPGGTPSSSTQQSPTVTYSSPGQYDVTLTVVNALGSNSLTQTAYVTVTGQTPACGGSTIVTDIDGNVYSIVGIGNQCWMAENLKVGRYSNGDYIPNQTLHDSVLHGAYDEYANYGYPTWDLEYGKPYNWYTVTDARNVCPAGWHSPDSTEYAELINYLGGFAIAGGAMKEVGIVHWDNPNTGATNSSGFTGLPNGNMCNGALFSSGQGGGQGNYWTTSAAPWGAYYTSLDAQTTVVSVFQTGPCAGFPVRCVKD